MWLQKILTFRYYLHQLITQPSADNQLLQLLLLQTATDCHDGPQLALLTEPVDHPGAAAQLPWTGSWSTQSPVSTMGTLTRTLAALLQLMLLLLYYYHSLQPR